jgi:uncharacterized membrane protein YecN with MAPEG domain
MLPITSLVAALGGIGLVGLSVSVSLRRMKAGTHIGVGDDPALLRRIRAQGNFIEYVPLALILIGLAENAQESAGLVWTIAGLLIAGRLLHAVGILNSVTALRAAGMLATYAALLIGAGVLLI